MKANRKFKDFKNNNAGFARIIGGLVALLICILVGVLIYWSIADSPSFAGTTYEEFTGYGATANASAWSVTIDYLPDSKGDTNVTCYNSTGNSESWPTFTLLNRDISVAAGAADEFSQVNVTYESKQEDAVGDVGGTAGTIFTLLPILAIVVIGGVMIGAVMAFGKSGKT